MFSIMRTPLFTVLVLICLSISQPSGAQDCPRRNPNGADVASVSRTLQGKVIFHDDLRQWLSLQLDSQVCGESVVELVNPDIDKPNPLPLEVFRGCRVRANGILGLPNTGYYSADLYQNVTHIEALEGCVRQPAFPEYSKMSPARSVRKYQVSMWFHYGPFADPVHAKIAMAKQVLSPWQIYAHYYLTGGFSFYGYCADGFTMSHMAGTPEANPWMVDNYLAMNPETAAAKHVSHIKVSFTCTRSP
jgi:hypothetical protein